MSLDFDHLVLLIYLDWAFFLTVKVTLGASGNFAETCYFYTYLHFNVVQRVDFFSKLSWKLMFRLLLIYSHISKGVFSFLVPVYLFMGMCLLSLAQQQSKNRKCCREVSWMGREMWAWTGSDTESSFFVFASALHTQISVGKREEL